MNGFATAEARSAFTAADGLKMESAVKAFVDNFNAVIGSNNRYFGSYVACELLNLVK
jgi:hypothetical protein